MPPSSPELNFAPDLPGQAGLHGHGCQSAVVTWSRVAISELPMELPLRANLKDLVRRDPHLEFL